MVNSINVLKAVALVGAAFLSSEAKTEEQLQGGWATNCVSLGRDTPKQCSMNHIVKMQSTGQVLLNITVRVAVKENQMPFRIKISMDKPTLPKWRYPHTKQCSYILFFANRLLE